MKTLALILIVSLAVGAVTWIVRPVKAVVVLPPLTYDDAAIEVLSHDERGVIFRAVRRCNNTDRDLDVTVSASWENRTPPIQVIPFQPVAFGAIKVPPGCDSPQSSAPQKLDYLPPGEWRARGSVCVVEGPCTGWVSRYLAVK